MAYADLNPIRAEITETLDKSHYTSVQQRLLVLDPNFKIETPNNPLDLKLVDLDNDVHPNALPMTTAMYVELVEWTGRIHRSDKRGFIPQNLPSIFETLRIDPNRFAKELPKLSHQHGSWIGKPKLLQEQALALAQKYVRGHGQNSAIS